MGIESKKEVIPNEEERLIEEYRDMKEFFQKPFGELFLDFCEHGRRKPSSSPEGVPKLADQFFKWLDEKRSRLTTLQGLLPSSVSKSIDIEFRIDKRAEKEDAVDHKLLHQSHENRLIELESRFGI